MLMFAVVRVLQAKKLKSGEESVCREVDWR